jgi:hypothetical protein
MSVDNMTLVMTSSISRIFRLSLSEVPTGAGLCVYVEVTVYACCEHHNIFSFDDNTQL